MLACGAMPVDAPRSSEDLAPPPVVVSEPTHAPPSDALARLIHLVAEERGLPPRAVPTLVALPVAELGRRALEQVRRTTPEPVRAMHERLLSSLELVPLGFDWLSAIERALAGRLRAFYDPELATIFVDRALVGSERKRALLHELVHALQDQHHALGVRLEYAPDAWDRRSALHALAEGDAEALVARLMSPATSVMAAAPSSSDFETSEQGTPGVLVRSLSAVYEDGLAFVEPRLAAGGWSAVDALFTDPPQTTHELMHAPSSGPRPPLPSLAHGVGPGADWERVYSDVLGAQTWRIVLEEWLPDGAARRAASAWAGDRLSAFEHGGAVALAWELRLDAEDRDSLRAVLARFRPPTHRAAKRSGVDGLEGFECRPHRDHGVVAAQVDGARLWLLSLTDAATDAACHGLADWASRLKLPAQGATWVRDASSVRADPGRQNVSTRSQ